MTLKNNYLNVSHKCTTRTNIMQMMKEHILERVLDQGIISYSGISISTRGEEKRHTYDKCNEKNIETNFKEFCIFINCLDFQMILL